MSSFFDKYINAVENTETIKYTGFVTEVKGLLIESSGPRSVVGEICSIKIPSTESQVLAEVIGFSGKTVKLMAYGETKGIESGCEVVASGHTLEVPVGPSLLGRVINSVGKACDGKEEIVPETFYPAINSAPDPMSKKPIELQMQTGVRAIDALLSVGRGQRIGFFAGSGIGKSTIVSMIARNAKADVNVIALIGERGREVREFIENDLGEEGLKRSVVVQSTGDESAISQLRAAYVATAVAEYFRDQGKDVMLMMDNVTRFAYAQRLIGLSNGEPPAQSGYPPSVFDAIPKLLERSGTNDKGSITAFYAVLVDGDDLNEPISDKVRGTLDGHIVLSRKLQEQQHYPAIDVLKSISRLASHINGSATKKAVVKMKKWLSDYSSQEDMINAGVYQSGQNPAIDEAIKMHQAMEDFLCQDKAEASTLRQTFLRMSELTGIEIPEEELTAMCGEEENVSSVLQNEHADE